MRKISDIKGEDALDKLAEIIEPMSEILSDQEIKEARDESNAKAISVAIKNHKKSVIKVLAVLDDESPEEYMNKVSLLTLPFRLLEILNDPEVATLFTSQGQTMESETSGSATGITKEEEK